MCLSSILLRANSLLQPFIVTMYPFPVLLLVSTSYCCTPSIILLYRILYHVLENEGKIRGLQGARRVSVQIYRCNHYGAFRPGLLVYFVFLRERADRDRKMEDGVWCSLFFSLYMIFTMEKYQTSINTYNNVLATCCPGVSTVLLVV